jgi:hypothetical protein
VAYKNDTIPPDDIAREKFKELKEAEPFRTVVDKVWDEQAQEFTPVYQNNVEKMTEKLAMSMAGAMFKTMVEESIRESTTTMDIEFDKKLREGLGRLGVDTPY